MPTVPETIIERAHEEGLRHFFGLPSSGVLLHLLDAGRQNGVAQSAGLLRGSHRGDSRQ